ncbi:MAG TPA: hypothetical protein DDZ84_06535 [Firmicutes bacterium]|nr:hypothetical protein [Bacillota bacterium]
MRAVKVFVDTSAWIALLALKDAHHIHAEGAFAGLLAGNALVVTSNYIVDETVTWLRMRAGYEVAVSFREIIYQSQECSRLHLAWITEPIERKAWELFTRHPGLKLSLTDCTTAVLAAQLKLHIWSYDSDFAAIGCSVWAD